MTQATNSVSTVSSQALSRMRFARQAGMQYDGERDVYRVAGYVPEGGLEFSHFWSRYERDAIAGRIVDMPAMTTWRNPPKIVEPGVDPDEPTKFMEEFERLADRLSLWSRLERTDRLSGIGRFGVLLIGTTGTDSDQFSQPQQRLKGPDDILYLSSFHEGHASVEKWATDITDPRFGLPDQYEIDLSSGVTGFPDAKAMVHHSRTLHFADDLLGDEVFGRPRLMRIYNVIQDVEKVSAGTGEAYWQLASRILQLAIDADATIDDGDMENLSNAIEEVYHDLRRYVALQGGQLSWLTSETPDPTGALDLYMTLIAVGSGWPKRILFGSETGERASTEDQKTYLGAIGERIERFAEPVLRAFIDWCIRYGALPAPADGYDVVWPNLFETPAKEIAERDKAVAETAKALAPLGGDPMTLVTIDEEGHPQLRPSAELGDDPFGGEPIDPLEGGEDDDE